MNTSTWIYIIHEYIICNKRRTTLVDFFVNVLGRSMIIENQKAKFWNRYHDSPPPLKQEEEYWQMLNILPKIIRCATSGTIQTRLTQ